MVENGLVLMETGRAALDGWRRGYSPGAVAIIAAWFVCIVLRYLRCPFNLRSGTAAKPTAAAEGLTHFAATVVYAPLFATRSGAGPASRRRCVVAGNAGSRGRLSQTAADAGPLTRRVAAVRRPPVPPRGGCYLTPSVAQQMRPTPSVVGALTANKRDHPAGGGKGAGWEWR